MARYVALLRGINVGGNNLIKMVELKACFESLGLADVRTYIQSGNALFASPETDTAKLTKTIEARLSKAFGYQSRLVLRSQKQLQAIVDDAPKSFGASPADYRYDVIFLKEPLTAAEAVQNITPNEGVDQVSAGQGVIYFSRLTSKASQSRLPRIIGTPMYQNMTIRTWNTTTKLLALLKS